MRTVVSLALIVVLELALATCAFVGDDVAAAPPAGSQALASSDTDYALQHGGLERHYRVHLPPNLQPDRPTPVVLALHGGGGNMDIQATERYYHFISSSDAHGYIVVFPNGYSRLRSGKLATWNAGNCCAAARDENIDDVGFIDALLDRLSQQYNVDPDRIYATGMSNGAMMSYRLACELSDRIVAIAAVAGTDNTRACNPARPVSVLHIHARDDDRVLFDGGAGEDSERVTDFTSVADSIDAWKSHDGCHKPIERVLDVPGAHCDAWTDCADQTAVQLCVTDGGGHSWPGGEKPRRRGSAPSTALSATDLAWAFFVAHPRSPAPDS